MCESDIEVATATTVTSLDDCEGALTTTTAIVIDPGQQIRLTYPAALRSAILTTNTATIISITGLTITALSPGAATVTQTGWPCSNDTTRCPVLTITVR